MLTLKLEPLTALAFAEFGDVIETEDREHFMINNGSTKRYHALAKVALSEPQDSAIISIFRAQAMQYPLQIQMMERHPRGSQAFIPLKGNQFLVLVAPAGEPPEPTALRAFIAKGNQGVNYHTGVWHHPILCTEAEDDFLVVDRQGAGSNCDEHFFSKDTDIVFDPGTR